VDGVKGAVAAEEVDMAADQVEILEAADMEIKVVEILEAAEDITKGVAILAAAAVVGEAVMETRVDGVKGAVAAEEVAADMATVVLTRADTTKEVDPVAGEVEAEVANSVQTMEIVTEVVLPRAAIMHRGVLGLMEVGAIK